MIFSRSGENPTTSKGGHGSWLAVSFVAVLVLCAAVPAIASASTLGWRVKEVPVTETVTTSWSGSLKLTDSAGNLSAECSDTGQGTAKVNGAGEVTSFTTSSCVPKGICESSKAPTITAKNLPWQSELARSEGVTRDEIKSGTGGEPKLVLACRVIGITDTVECSGPLSLTTTNGTTNVTATFDKTKTLKCNNGSSAVGTVEGTQTISSSAGKLSANYEETAPHWTYNGVAVSEKLTTVFSGHLRFTDHNGNFGELEGECSDSGEASVSPEGKGEITKMTFTGCAGISCSAIQAAHLPWTTQLYTAESGTRRDLTTAGEGPRLVATCFASNFGTVEDVCTGALAPRIKNPSSNENRYVIEEYEEELACKAGPFFGQATITGTQNMESPLGGVLRVS